MLGFKACAIPQWRVYSIKLFIKIITVETENILNKKVLVFFSFLLLLTTDHNMNFVHITHTWFNSKATVCMETLSTRGFAPRCVKAETLVPEGSMIRYDTKKKNEQKT